MTMHLSWMFCHPRLGIAVINLHTKSEVSEDMKVNAKSRTWDDLGCFRVTYGHQHHNHLVEHKQLLN